MSEAIIWIPVVLAFNSAIGGFALVQGKSMQPTMNLHSDNTVVVLNRFFPKMLSRYRRGSVVLINAPDSGFKESKPLIKRLVGIEHDWVKRRNGSIIRVPPGHCWIEGDNADNSLDSDEYGPLPLSLIEANVIAKIWPLGQVGMVRPVVDKRRVNAF